MPTTKRNYNRLSKKYFASAIIKKLEKTAKDIVEEQKEAGIKSLEKHIAEGKPIPKEVYIRPDEKIFDLVREYSRKKAYYEKVIDETGKKRVLGSIRSEAIKLIIKGVSASKMQLNILNLTPDTIHFERELYNLLGEWNKGKYLNSEQIRQGLRAVAVGGKQIDYSELGRLKKELAEARIEENSLSDILPEEEPNRGETFTANEIIITAFEIAREKRIELERKVEAEGWRCSAEKSEHKNLCYFLLYDMIIVMRPDVLEFAEAEGHIINPNSPEDTQTIKSEDSRRVVYRIQHLSKHNQKVLIQIICKIYNKENEGDLITDVKLQYNIGRRKKKLTKAEKEAKIIELQADNYSQSQVVKETGFSLKTVKRAWI